ncbi:hypothetical protein WM22_12865 [Burkholderia ubonensis]|nr:hypothetical protein WM19_15565 [Burkholderia ubonensis]KWK98616.1 hypothetical protein WM20_14080 [Burkholderia ubonensis]KWN38361.1 hypothetical protein WM22_12865 [Burkholderia ubonensis]
MSSVSSCAITRFPASRPPSTGSATPVMIRAAGEHRNSAACATSSGVAKASSAHHFLSCSNICGLRRTRASRAGVFIVPGSTSVIQRNRMRLLLYLFARAGRLRREKIAGARGGNAHMLRGVPGKWDAAAAKGSLYERAAAVV